MEDVTASNNLNCHYNCHYTYLCTFFHGWHTMNSHLLLPQMFSLYVGCLNEFSLWVINNNKGTSTWESPISDKWLINRKSNQSNPPLPKFTFSFGNNFKWTEFHWIECLKITGYRTTERFWNLKIQNERSDYAIFHWSPPLYIESETIILNWAHYKEKKIPC